MGWGANSQFGGVVLTLLYLGNTLPILLRCLFYSISLFSWMNAHMVLTCNDYGV